MLQDILKWLQAAGKNHIFVKGRIEKGLLQNSCNIQHMEFEVPRSYIVYRLYSATALFVFYRILQAVKKEIRQSPEYDTVPAMLSSGQVPHLYQQVKHFYQQDQQLMCHLQQ